MSCYIPLETLAAVACYNLQYYSPLEFIVVAYDHKTGELKGKQESCTSGKQFWGMYDGNDLSEKDKRDIYWRVYFESKCGQNCIYFIQLIEKLMESYPNLKILHQNHIISLKQIYISCCTMTIQDIKPRIQFKIIHNDGHIISYPMYHTTTRNLNLYDKTSKAYQDEIEHKKEYDRIHPKFADAAVKHYFLTVRLETNDHDDAQLVHLDFAGITYINTANNRYLTNKVKYYHLRDCVVPISLYETKHLQIKKYEEMNESYLILDRTSENDENYILLGQEIRAFEYALNLPKKRWIAINLFTPKEFILGRKKFGEELKEISVELQFRCLEQCTSLIKGSFVLLCGLKQNKSLNGRKGKIINVLNVAKQRFDVKIDDYKKSVRVSNLALIFPFEYKFVC